MVLLLQGLKASFTHRRKTLWNNLASCFGKSDEIKTRLEIALNNAALSPNVRGEALDLQEFSRLSR